MATVFMKWLETSPKDYDRGILLLTLGRIKKLKQDILNGYVHAGMNVLEIGCGTGELAVEMAKRGAQVSAIDASPLMLAEAQKRVEGHQLEENVTLRHMDAALISERFPHESFDLIVSTLVFSEFSADEQRYVLNACKELLKPDGQIVIGDETVPRRWPAKAIYYLVRIPLVILTWLLTRTSTSPMNRFQLILQESGFSSERVTDLLLGSLVLFEGKLYEADSLIDGLPLSIAGRLKHQVNLRTILLDVWSLFFRIIPPYPKIRPGVYAVGDPDKDSPVLVTGNYDLTVRRLVRAIDKKVDAWILVASSSGINVWCAAGGGYFTAEKIIAVLKSAQLADVVNHRALILPQLCANGVDGWRIREETGWGVHWGPVKAEDIPAYLSAKRKKTDRMRWVEFPIKDRMEMVNATLGLYGLMILVPVLIFWRSSFWNVTFSLVGLSYFYAVALPWLPGKDGLIKSIPLTLIAWSGFWVYMLLFTPLPTPRIFNWMIGLTGLSVFVGGELQGMSPLMRGEQANWGWEAVIAIVLGLIYWLVPLAVGWR